MFNLGSREATASTGSSSKNNKYLASAPSHFLPMASSGMSENRDTKMVDSARRAGSAISSQRENVSRSHLDFDRAGRRCRDRRHSSPYTEFVTTMRNSSTLPRPRFIALVFVAIAQLSSDESLPIGPAARPILPCAWRENVAVRGRATKTTPSGRESRRP